MTETVVHVTTLEQWKSVLDIWFKQGYSWYSGDQEYRKEYFESGNRELLLDSDNDILNPLFGKRESIGYADFMSQQRKEGKEMEKVYEVSQSVFDELQRIKAHEGMSLLESIVGHAPFIKFIKVGNKAILRYLADDQAIDFKVKETLYRLWRIDDDGDTVYMKFGIAGTPTYTSHEDDAFTAPLEEIKKHKTPAWEIENADENWGL